MQNFKLSCLCMSPSGGLSISRPGLFIPSTSPLVGLSIARRPVFTSPETQPSLSSVWPEYVSSTVSLTLMKCYRPIYEWDKECTRINNLDRCHFNPTKLSLAQFSICNSKLRSELNTWKEDFLRCGLGTGGHIWHTVSANGRSGTKPCHRMDPD